MKINFIDLGAYKGDTIDIFLNSIKKSKNIDYRIFGVEAFPNIFNICENKFKNNDKVQIYNFAIGLLEGPTKLYYGRNFDIGQDKACSIHIESKNILPSKYIYVNCIKFSTWFNTLNIDKKDINIIKSNMEGAELELVKDMDEHNLFEYFDYYTGNLDYWTNDIRKMINCNEDVEYVINTLLKHNIKFTPLTEINLDEYSI